MLREHEWSEVDLKEFYTNGEGFASWYYKVRKWLRDERPSIIPEIKLVLSRGGRLVLKDREVISFIAKKLNVEKAFIADLIKVEIQGIQPAATFLFGSDFKSSDRVVLETTPRQFCMSCFKDALSKKEIPVFDSYWQSPWATHCVHHNTPLFPAELLDERNHHLLLVISDGTQFEYWCNRVEFAQKRVTHPNMNTPSFRVLPISSQGMSINKLFNSPKEAKRAVKDLGLNQSPEYVRQQFCAVFFLLTRKAKNFSVGYNLTNTDLGDWCFPTTGFYSAEVLERLKPERINRCIEYIANFIANSKKCHPYLLRSEMISGREEFTKNVIGDCSEIQTSPMVFLAWLMWVNFEEGFVQEVETMFPLYGSSWKGFYGVIDNHLP